MKMDILNKKYGANLLLFHQEFRKRSIDLENERLFKGMNEEEYALFRIQKSPLNLISPQKHSYANDDGIDFAISLENRFLLIQLKWWRQALSKKAIKTIFGEIYFSDLAMKIREEGLEIKYILAAPFLASSVALHSTRFARHDFHLVSGDDFVRFLTNPHFFLTHKLEVSTHEC